IGPSGCGKTTTMKMINRLIETTEGNIFIEGENVRDKNVVELRRFIGYVIQQIGLFPHMTIEENISLVPKLLNWPEQQRKLRAKELLELVDMDPDYLKSYPHELSGGQQQRIGVLRALAADPPLILMDEPFGALDPITRDGLQDEFINLQQSLGKTIVFVTQKRLFFRVIVELDNLQQSLGKTMVFVTHDMDQAIKRADRIVIMKEGEIVQVGTPEEILRAPANEFVEEFIGKHRLIESRPTLRTVEQIMNREPIAITKNQTLSEAIKIMKEKRVDSLLVIDRHRIFEGIIDIEMIEKYRKKRGYVKEVMETNVHKVKQHSLLRDTVRKILRNGKRYVPVVDEANRLTGIVTRASLANIVYDSIWGEKELLG